MNPFFSILSLAYIAGIFLFADSPVVSDLAAFNPYSLLHIPLYGILTFLLILSFSPFKFRVINSGNPTNSTNPINLSRLPCNEYVRGEMRPALCSVETTTWGSLFHWDPTSSINLLIPGLIALGVAVADEIHQAYIPTRNASITDVLLDIIGILFFIFLFRRVQSIRWFLKKVEFLCQRTLKR
jgi:hypothetical protein